jgi:hypothetical protein
MNEITVNKPTHINFQDVISLTNYLTNMIKDTQRNEFISIYEKYGWNYGKSDVYEFIEKLSPSNLHKIYDDLRTFKSKYINENLFSIEWWKNNVISEILDENFSEYDKEIIDKVIKGFKLIYSQQGFGYSFKTKTGQASPNLADRINNWIKKEFPHSTAFVRFEKSYKTINFLKKTITEIKVEKPQYITVDKLWDYIVTNNNKYNHSEIVHNILNNKYGRRGGQYTYEWLKTLSSTQLSNIYKDLKNEFEKKINEIQLGREPSPYEPYVRDNEDKIEAAAEYFNYPIPDLQYAFFLGKEVVLSDDIWSKLENSKSYEAKSLEDIVKEAHKKNINIQPYIDAIKNEKNLPLPLIFNYEPNKYYLVGGEMVLSLYKVLNVIPVILMATLDLQDKKNIDKQTYELTEYENEIEKYNKDKFKEENKFKKEISKFLKYIIKELNLNHPPAGLTLSRDEKQAQSKHTFGYFDPQTNKIWLYIKNRNLADILRTLSHECIHLKQAEEGRIETHSGETGSPIENEANAKAGIYLRKYGAKNPQIYGDLIKEKLKEIKVEKPQHITVNKLWNYISSIKFDNDDDGMMYWDLMDKHGYEDSNLRVHEWLETLSPSQLLDIYNNLQNRFGGNINEIKVEKPQQPLVGTKFKTKYSIDKDDFYTISSEDKKNNKFTITWDFNNNKGSTTYLASEVHDFFKKGDWIKIK